jgi:hypothetical protein
VGDDRFTAVVTAMRSMTLDSAAATTCTEPRVGHGDTILSDFDQKGVEWRS